MDNYTAALDYFLSEPVTENVITAVGMNRKSGGTGEKAYDKPYYRFFKLLRSVVIDHERFDHTKLIDLFEKFEQRDDNAIRQAVTNNADIPTIFEYILGIAWYTISGREGDVLSYMNLSLEADLLPRTHAIGGNADIEYVYPQTPEYPAHTLLIEATLADKTNQRRMEMEPVSRHLGEHILSTGDKEAYCVFVSTFLHRNVFSDFRYRKTFFYYGVLRRKLQNGCRRIEDFAACHRRTSGNIGT
ncbi:MAG: AlwI family type II restriction endonuclease [Spirochaetaceae bacterium]|jgi:hypothetical protein|nr:AlwI family type II restriction endonuclease [Spirochaetaceae bacterium]